MGRVTDTISGGLATFRTPGKQQIRSLKAYFTPKQEGSGTPSPDNVRPITGWTGIEVYRTGKNLCDTPTSADIASNWPFASAFEKTIYGLPIDKTFTLQANITKDLGENVSNTRFYLNGKLTSGKFFSTGTPIGVKSISNQPADNGTLKMSHNRLGLVSYGAEFNNIQLELGSTPTDYEPYNGTTLPIDWSSAGTVYGGYVDLVSGEVWEEEAAFMFDGSSDEPWQLNGNDGFYYNRALYSEPVQRITVCDHYKAVANNSTARMSEGECAMNATGFMVQIYDTSETTVVGFKQKLSASPVTVIVKPATPTLVTTLTPTALRTLIGTNNIWCNSGDVSVEYDFAESREMSEARKRVMAFDARNRLPNAYQKVEYIQSDSAYTTYIDTGVPIASDVEMEMQISVPSVTGSKYLLGRYINNAAGDFYLYASSGSTAYFQTAYGCTYNNTTKTCDTAKHTFRFDITNGMTYVYCDGTEVLHKTILSTITERPIQIAGTSMGAARLSCITYLVRISKGGALIRNFIPCVRKSDNKPGMYDTVSKTFYTNAGTGEFVVPA